MNGHIDAERILDAYLAPEADRLPDRVLDAALADIARTPQRRALRVPWRFPTMPALSRATGIAAVALVAVVSAGGLLYVNSKGPGGPGDSPTATTAVTAAPTAALTAAPTPGPTVAAVPPGDLRSGTYVAHPLPAPHASLSVTFTVPSGWAVLGADSVGGLGMSLLGEGGVGIQFVDVTSLNGDLCRWAGRDDDVAVGTSVDDLVAALVSQSALGVEDPVDVTIGGYTGKRVDIVAPTEPFLPETDEAPGCDEGRLRLWSTTQFGEGGVYLQGAANRWQANIVDVEGTRLVVVVQDFPETPAAARAELDAIVSSMIIKP
jgi:hypothetical protein